MQQLQQSKRNRATRTNAVAAGSVWETRMKMDQVSGGIKVFEGESTEDPQEPTTTTAPPPNPDPQPTTKTQRKRKNWKQPELESDPIELRRALSQLARVPETEEASPPCDPLLEEETAFDHSTDHGNGGGVGVEIMEVEKKGAFDDKDMDLEEEKKADRIRDLPVSFAEIGGVLPMEVEDFEDSVQQEQNRIQSIVDLLMWRDISRSVLVFGIGSFLLILSSYVQNLDFSFISAVSYLGLFYLALVFLYESFFTREVDQQFGEGEKRWLIGEEEAIWMTKTALPYTNAILLRLRSFFSGDPATTMKLALILFGLGKCGGQITVWTMSKLVFFGLFTIPRLWAAHSDLIWRYGTFLLHGVKGTWMSCGNKKVASVVLFALFWSLSSVTSRIWAVFMLLVALRYYHDHVLAVAETTPTGDQRERGDALDPETELDSSRIPPPPEALRWPDAALRPRMGPAAAGRVQQRKRG